MNTKILLTSSAWTMGAAGVACSFAPHELLGAAGVPPSETAAVLVQLLGAALFGFAMVNWMARGSLIGGIYNRPLAVGNTAHFVIGGLAAAKAVLSNRSVPLAMAAVVYLLFAVGFGLVLFRSPARGGEPG